MIVRKQKMMKLETDLRKWVRSQKGLIPRWVEPARGATIGTPDMWFMIPVSAEHVATVWVELKLAAVMGSVLKFEVRPQQRKVLRGITAEGGTALILVGEKMGDRKWLMKPDEDALNGRVRLADPGMKWVGDGPNAMIVAVMNLIGS